MRAFLAASPDEHLREHLAALQQRLAAVASSSEARISWTRPETIHLTFRFFADFDDRLVAPLREAVELIAREAATISVPLSRLGAFPRPLAPRVLWLGPPPEWESTGEGKRLLELAASIDRVCAGLALAPEEKPCRPHLTLARIKDGERAAGRVLAEAQAFDQQAIAIKRVLIVNAIAFVRSDATSGGHVHSRLWTVPIPGMS